MARTKEVFEIKYVPGSARAEGKNRVAFNMIRPQEPDRIHRASMGMKEFEAMLRDFHREKERAAARDIFNLGE